MRNARAGRSSAPSVSDARRTSRRSTRAAARPAGPHQRRRGWARPPAGGRRDVPWRRWLLIGGGILGLLVVFGLLGGVVNLITDLMWYGALGRRDVLSTRLWAQVALFGIGFVAMLAARARQHLARRDGSRRRRRSAARRDRAAGRVARHRHRPRRWWRPPLARLRAPRGAAAGRRCSSSKRRRVGRDRSDPRARHRLLRLRPAVLSVRPRLGVDDAHRHRAADASEPTRPARCAGSSTSPRRCGRTSRSSARCCWS